MKNDRVATLHYVSFLTMIAGLGFFFIFLAEKTMINFLTSAIFLEVAGILAVSASSQERDLKLKERIDKLEGESSIKKE